MATTKAPHVTRAHIEQYLELEAQRLELQRQARELDKQASAIEADLVKFVQVNGGKARSVVRSGFTLAIVEKKGSVACKQEFVSIAGHAKAEELIAAAPPREALTVQRAA